MTTPVNLGANQQLLQTPNDVKPKNLYHITKRSLTWTYASGLICISNRVNYTLFFLNAFILIISGNPIELEQIILFAAYATYVVLVVGRDIQILIKANEMPLIFCLCEAAWCYVCRVLHLFPICKEYVVLKKKKNSLNKEEKLKLKMVYEDYWRTKENISLFQVYDSLLGTATQLSIQIAFILYTYNETGKFDVSFHKYFFFALLSTSTGFFPGTIRESQRRNLLDTKRTACILLFDLFMTGTKVLSIGFISSKYPIIVAIYFAVRIIVTFIILMHIQFSKTLVFSDEKYPILLSLILSICYVFYFVPIRGEKTLKARGFFYLYSGIEIFIVAFIAYTLWMWIVFGVFIVGNIIQIIYYSCFHPSRRNSFYSNPNKQTIIGIN